jgi:hypothetical protein
MSVADWYKNLHAVINQCSSLKTSPSEFFTSEMAENTFVGSVRVSNVKRPMYQEKSDYTSFVLAIKELKKSSFI